MAAVHRRGCVLQAGYAAKSRRDGAVHGIGPSHFDGRRRNARILGKDRADVLRPWLLHRNKPGRGLRCKFERLSGRRRLSIAQTKRVRGERDPPPTGYGGGGRPKARKDREARRISLGRGLGGRLDRKSTRLN